MTILTAANPLAEAAFGHLQDVVLQAAIGGRLYDDIPRDTPRPCVLYEIFSERENRGLGTGGFPEVEIRTHVFSEVGSMAEAQAINLQIVVLLKDALLTATGYQQAGKIVYRETVILRDQELYGVKVHEVVSRFTGWWEQTT